MTYNLGIYPPMHHFLMDMKTLNLQKRTVAIIENGSWACKSGTLMEECLGQLKKIELLNERVSLVSAMNEEKAEDMDALADSLVESLKKREEIAAKA